MSRFAVDGWEPNLRIEQEQRPVCEPALSIFDNKLRGPKKDGNVCGRIAASRSAQHVAACERREPTSESEGPTAHYRLCSEGSRLQSESLQLG
jgi:hypothetical protein